MITVWRGSGNQWDCDEMGHMNVRVYVEKMMEGLAGFAGAIEMPHAFRQGTPSTLIPVDQHIRFIREVLPGRPLTMTACVLEVGASDAVIYQEMTHSDGSVAAAFRTRVIHAVAETGQPFAWSQRSQAALTDLLAQPPAHSAPRSLDPDGPVTPDDEATLARVANVGAPMIGAGAVPPDHCDVSGRMRAPWFMGRISDSVPNLLFDWRAKLAKEAGDVRFGAAVLEYRLVYRRWPRAGDRFQAHTSLGRTEDKVHSLVHWMMDPDTGLAWMTSEAVAVTFDLDTRKVIPAPPEHAAELETIAPRGLKV